MIWELLNRNSIRKESDPFLYSQMKEILMGKKNPYNEILNKLNWEIMITPEMIILKKTIEDTDSYMGIQGFKDKMDYVFLSGIYYYININHNNVFAAEDIIEYLKIIFENQNITVDFLSIRMKFSIYRALLYCEKQGYIEKLDGDASYLIEENPLTDGVLYRNTGYARNIEVISTRETTQNKVYRSLLLKPIIYFNDYNTNIKRYIGNHFVEIEDDFKTLIGSDINLIYQDSFAAILIPNNMEIRSGRRDMCKEYPKNNMNDLLLCRMITYLREYIISKNIQPNNNEIYLTRNQFLTILKKMKKKDIEWWTKEYQNMSLNQLEKTTLNGLKEWNAITFNEKIVTVYPLISMIQGELV